MSLEQRARWDSVGGGLLLAVGAFAFVPIVYEYVFVVGLPNGTGEGGSLTTEDFAIHTRSHWDLLSGGWRFEILAMAALAAAGLTLLGRPGYGRVGWALLVVGALITCPMYALMLGGYNAALNGASQDLGLYNALRGIAFEFFYSGIAVMRLGLAAVFLAEVATQCSMLWRGLFVMGFATNLFSSIAFIALFWGASIPMPIVSPVGMLGFILTGILGLRLISHRFWTVIN